MKLDLEAPPSVPGTALTPEEIISHPMVKFVMEKLDLKVLEPSLVKALTEPVRVRTESGEVLTKGSLLHLWERESGFDSFVKVRIPQLLSFNSPMSPLDMLKNLKKLTATVDGGSKKMPGFYQWSKKSGYAVLGTKPAEAPVVLPDPDKGKVDLLAWEEDSE